jgi:hypothetical protein
VKGGRASDAIAKRVMAIMRDSAATAIPAAASPRSAKIESPAEPTAEQKAALAAASRTFDQVLSRGRLNREEVLEMRRQLLIANQPDEARELSRRIALALNTDKLVPEDPALVFP